MTATTDRIVAARRPCRRRQGSRCSTRARAIAAAQLRPFRQIPLRPIPSLRRKIPVSLSRNLDRILPILAIPAWQNQNLLRRRQLASTTTITSPS